MSFITPVDGVDFFALGDPRLRSGGEGGTRWAQKPVTSRVRRTPLLGVKYLQLPIYKATYRCFFN